MNIMQINGWVEEIRDIGKLKFLIVHTPEGKYQITIHKEKVSKDIFKTSEKITRQSCISVSGELIKKTQAKIGKEIIPKKLEILGLAQTPLPLDPSGKVHAELDTRLDWRFLDFRNEKNVAIFRIQNEIIKAFREYLIKNNFFEIQTPGIISSASEGGAELFKIQYFEKNAYLAQSPQLYKQMGALSFGKVFTIVPIWRAEKFNKPTHLNEIRQMDVEVAFIKSEEDVMKILENIVVYIIKSVNKNCKKELKLLNKKINIPKLPFKRVKYDDAIKALKKEKEQIEWGDDFSKLQEAKLGKIFGNIFFLKDWPTKAKNFYTMPYENNKKICHAFDLVYNGIEIASGTQRIHIPELLKNQIKEFGLKPKNFEYYINCFKYGSPPHAGWSIGLERITMSMLGLENIRECCMFPRDRNRLTP